MPYARKERIASISAKSATKNAPRLHIKVKNNVGPAVFKANENI